LFPIFLKLWGVQLQVLIKIKSLPSLLSAYWRLPESQSFRNIFCFFIFQ
jgi:hypothetical protein